MPSIANHANLKGFTTQKLAWGSAYGTPFDIGKWYGVDGNYIYASVNPHDYYFTLTKLRNWDLVQNKLEVYAATADEIYHDIDNKLTDEQRSKLPEWKTELVMQNHGVGGYTSRAVGKRWNRRCEELADIAESTAESCKKMMGVHGSVLLHISFTMICRVHPFSVLTAEAGMIMQCLPISLKENLRLQLPLFQL